MAAVSKKREPVDPWVSVLEASRVLRVNRYSVLVKALKGELKYGLANGNVVIGRASVERIANVSQTAA